MIIIMRTIINIEIATIFRQCYVFFINKRLQRLIVFFLIFIAKPRKHFQTKCSNSNMLHPYILKPLCFVYYFYYLHIAVNLIFDVKEIIDRYVSSHFLIKVKEDKSIIIYKECELIL